MKPVLAIFLLVIGLLLIVTGYTAPKRAQAEIELMDRARGEVAVMDAQREAGNAVAETKANYDRTIADIEAHRPTSPTIRAEQLPRAQLEPLFKGLNNHLDDLVLEKTSSIAGTIQYCTGWLMIAAGCIVVSLGRNKNCSNPVVENISA